MFDDVNGPVHNDRAITNKHGDVTGRVIFDFGVTQCRDWTLRPVSAIVRLNRRVPWAAASDGRVQLRFRKSVGTDVREEFITRRSDPRSVRMLPIDSWIAVSASVRRRQ